MTNKKENQGFMKGEREKKILAKITKIEKTKEYQLEAEKVFEHFEKLEKTELMKSMTYALGNPLIQGKNLTKKEIELWDKLWKMDPSVGKDFKGASDFASGKTSSKDLKIIIDNSIFELPKHKEISKLMRKLLDIEIEKGEKEKEGKKKEKLKSQIKNIKISIKQEESGFKKRLAKVKNQTEEMNKRIGITNNKNWLRIKKKMENEYKKEIKRLNRLLVYSEKEYSKLNKR